MTRMRRLHEEQIRVAEFHHAETRTSRKEEIDIYRSQALAGDQIEIRVHLAPDPTRSRDPLMIYSSIEILDAGGYPLRILGEDGRPLDQEMAEVLAWEMIEDEDLALTYIDGRSPGRVRAPAPAASRSSPEIDFEM